MPDDGVVRRDSGPGARPEIRPRKPLSQAGGVTFLGFKNGVATYRLESGSHDLTSALR